MRDFVVILPTPGDEVGGASEADSTSDGDSSGSSEEVGFRRKSLASGKQKMLALRLAKTKARIAAKEAKAVQLCAKNVVTRKVKAKQR
jgi:hypothetical protein